MGRKKTREQAEKGGTDEGFSIPAQREATRRKAEQLGAGIVEEFVGHGIGTALHEEPQVPNYGPAGKREVIREGMTLAIEPMINIGKPTAKVLDDGWTAVTNDGSRCAQFEHTLVVTDDGAEVLTLPDSDIV